MPKRCPNGSRRNRKTQKCVRKTAMGKKKRCPNGSRRNRKTKQCVRKSKMKKSLTKTQKSFLNTIRESPGSVKRGVITGVKTMESLGQSAVKSLPRFSKKKGGNDDKMINKALKDGLITKKQHNSLPPQLLKAIIKKKSK